MPKFKHLVSLHALKPEQIHEILTLAARFKIELKQGKEHALLKQKTLAMIFEKPSTRTRVSFEVGMVQLGGHVINLRPDDIQMDGREPVSDIARTLSRMVQGIMLRTFAHETIERFAEFAEVPVINGLSDYEHPCQALADMLTLIEHFGHLDDIVLTYVGDGNNVAHSLMFAAAKVGLKLRVCTPKGYEPSRKALKALGTLKNKRRGIDIELLRDPRQAVAGAQVVYTDVWASMGQEAESAQRERDFRAYQVNAALLKHADPKCLVMHCLPAHRGLEITAAVIDGPQSIVFDQAENRLHAQKAVLALLMS